MRKEFDVVVVGAGMAGASVAAELGTDHSVLVLERESQPGYHSTGRSAALFSQIYGNFVVRALSRCSRGFLVSPPAGFCAHPLVAPRGTLFIATREQIPSLEEFASAPDVAAAVAAIPVARALEMCPILRGDRLAGAVYEPDSLDLDVHGLHQGYLRLLRARGGEIVTDGELRGLERIGGRWAVETSVGRFDARILVNAAGAWADEVGRMAGALPIGLQPRRRTAVLIEAPADTSTERWPMVIDADEQYYFKPDAGRLLLSPADETPVSACDVQPEEWDVAVAVDRFETATTFPVRRVIRRWAGLRSFVEDRSPVAGYDATIPGFFWLAGQGGYGIQTAPCLARTAAALIRGAPVPEDLAGLGVSSQRLSPARLSVTEFTSGSR
jgi:D-arginine dehydrogenase